jgi:AcrR family transcriptional regulator
MRAVTTTTSPASPKNKRLELGEQSRENLLEVATRLMSARGYEGTSISAIAKESGLPASSIYWHFSSKVGVLAAVMDRGYARFRAEAATMQVPTTGSHHDKILALFEQGISLLEANPEFVRLQIILLLNPPQGAVNDSVLRIRQKAREGMQTVLTEVFADLGDRRAGVVAVGLAQFVGASFDGIFLAQQAGSTDISDLLRQLARATAALADITIASLNGRS